MSRVALITGSGAPRIGADIAKEAARRGYTVALHYHSSRTAAEELCAELNKSGGEHSAFCADVSREDQVREMFRGVRERYGRLDLLVTSAAIWDEKPLLEVSAADVRRHFEINTLGTFLCCRYAGEIMAHQPEGGVIITIGDWAIERPYRNYSAYFPSKGAIPTLTRTFAVELVALNPNIRVNCVHPGAMMIPATVAPEEREKSRRHTLLKRLGSAGHISKAVFSLVENDYITGACLSVDGGRLIADGSGG